MTVERVKRRLHAPVRVLLGGREQGNGWSFPASVRELLKRECEGKRVLQLFGGRADFGTRLDIDAIVRPDVIGDAWLPPFAKDSFETVIMDPPYISINSQQKNNLFAGAGWVARERVIWFSTLWVDWAPQCELEKAWLVQVSNLTVVRALQFFRVRTDKRVPDRHFTRGPAIRYNRWLAQPESLPFGNPRKEG